MSSVLEGRGKEYTLFVYNAFECVGAQKSVGMEVRSAKDLEAGRSLAFVA